MASSVHADLLFPHEIDQRLAALSKYDQLVSPVLKKRRKSHSCSKLPPLNSLDKGSPVLSATSTRASSTTSTWSPSRSSSCVSLNSPDRGGLLEPSASRHASSKTSMRSHSNSPGCILSPDLSANRKSPPSMSQSMQQSRRSSSSTRTSDCELFPKLPNSLTDALFVSRHHRAGQKAPSQKAASVITPGQAAKSTRRPQNGNGPVALPKRLAHLLEQHHTITKLFNESNTFTDKCHSDTNHSNISGVVDKGTANSEQPSLSPAHQCDGSIEKEHDHENRSCSENLDASSFNHEEPRPAPTPKELTTPDLQTSPALTPKEPTVLSPPSSQPVGVRKGAPSRMDDSLLASTIEALVSPLRNVKITKMPPRKLFRGQTVGMRMQMDANSIPAENRQDVTSTFAQYDEDNNGRLSVSEFHKLLNDQGIVIDIADVEETVAMLVSKGSSSFLSSPTGVDLASFSELVAHGVRAQALRDQQFRGYSKEEADTLRGVFDAYDVNHSGVIEASELGNLLQDIGQAPQTFSEQEELHRVLKRIVGGSLRPLQFRDFLYFAKILETTTVGSGGRDQTEHRPDQRRPSDRIVTEIARKVGLTMADVAQLEDIFATHTKNEDSLSSTDLYDLLKSRLKLKTAEGERELQVHSTIEKYVGPAGSIDFEDFLVIIGDLVDTNLATVSSILGSTNHFLSNLATLLE